MTRDNWNKIRNKNRGGDAWNPHAKYFVAFQDPAVVSVVGYDRPVSGLWQRVRVKLADGRIVNRTLCF